MKFCGFFLPSLGLLLILSTFVWADIHPANLRCEYRVNPLDIDDLHPRLNWIVTSELRNQQQSAYHILVASSQEKLARNEGDLWDSGTISSPWKMVGLCFIWSR